MRKCTKCRRNKGLHYSNSDILGEKNPMSKLNKNQVIEIREKYTGKYGQLTELSKEYNVSPACIKKIIERQTWKDIYD